MNRRDFLNSIATDDGDADLPGGLERIECAECGHGVITNAESDVDRCNGCRE